MVWLTQYYFLGLFLKRGKNLQDFYLLHSSFLTPVKCLPLYSGIQTIFERVWYKLFWTLLRYTVQEHMMMSLLLQRKEEEPILPVVKAEPPTCTINSTSGGVVANVWVEA